MNWLLENSLLAVVAAALVWLLSRWFRPSPALAHLLWVLVLAKLLCPPLLEWSVPLPDAATLGLTAAKSAPSKPEISVQPLVTAPGVTNLPYQGPRLAAATESTSLSRAVDQLPPQPAGVVWHWSAFLCLAWAVGSLLVLLSMLRSIRAVRRLCSRTRPVPEWLRTELQRLSDTLGIRAPDLVVAEGISSAFVMSISRPRLYWPAGQLDPARLESIRSILAHELAHIRRRDHWVAWLEVTATVVLWWHPLLWVARQRLRTQAELACDAWAIWAVPTARRAYAGALIDALEQDSLAVTAVPVLGARPSACRAFETRLNMILHEQVPYRLSRWAWLPVAALTFTVLSGLSMAQDKKRSKSRETRDSKRVERRVEREIERDVLQQVNKHLRDSLGKGFQIDKLSDLDGKLQEYIRRSKDSADTGKKAKSKPGARTRRSLRGRRARRDAGDDRRAALRQGLEEARAEIRKDADLKRLGLTEDVEALVESVLSGKQDFGDALPSLISKAMKGALKEAKVEIRGDADLKRLGLTEDIEKILDGLGDLEGGSFDIDLGGLLGKTVKGALKEARAEIRQDVDLKRLGIAGDIEKILEDLGDLEGGLHIDLGDLLGKTMKGALKEARAEIRQDPDLKRLGIAEDIDKILRSVVEGGGDIQVDLENVIRKAVGSGLKDAQLEIEGSLRDVDVDLDLDLKDLIKSLRKGVKGVKGVKGGKKSIRIEGLNGDLGESIRAAVERAIEQAEAGETEHKIRIRRK